MGFAKVKPISTQCSMIITALNDYDFYIASTPKDIPAAWLPNGSKAPCKYELEICSEIELSPLILASQISTPIPGLTKPFKCKVISRANWENTGRDPLTKKYFLEE